LGDRVAKVHYRLDPEWLRPFVDPALVVERCRKLLETREDLSPEQRLALSQLLKEHEDYQSGGNPNDPFSELFSKI